MKSIRLLKLFLALALVSPAVVHAETSTPLPTSLKGVAVAEIPAQAAAQIAAVKPEEREATAIALVTSAVKAHPTIASAIVGAVCTKCPEVAAAVSKAAISVQPKQAQIIVRAATAAAPDYAADITKALVALSEATPSLKPELTPLIASLQAAPTQVASTTPLPTETTTPTRPARGPIVSGPYIPLSGTPTNSAPGTPVPPGGRDYARP